MNTTTPVKTYLLSTIPFAGFYETCHSEQLEQLLNVSDYDFDNATDNEETPEQVQARYDAIEWTTEQNTYASCYSDCLSDATGITFVYESIHSPKSYNFVTDSIYVKIELNEVLKMFNKITHNSNLLENYIQENFTSCDGFSSFYSNDIQDWYAKPVHEYDHNEVGAIIECYIVSLELADNMYGLECELSMQVYL